MLFDMLFVIEYVEGFEMIFNFGILANIFIEVSVFDWMGVVNGIYFQ